MNAKLPEQKAPTAKVAWADSIYVPKSLSAGMAEIISGKTIGPEMKYYEVLLIVEGEAEVKERKTGEKCNIRNGDLVLLKKGANVTIIAKRRMKYLYVTVPPHSEAAEVYYLEKEE